MADSENKIKSSEITPESVYLNRRNLIKAGLIAGTTVATGFGYRFFNPRPVKTVEKAEIENFQKSGEKLTDELTDLDDITGYNNYYEYSTSKTAVAAAAVSLKTRPWKVRVDGLVNKPRDFGIEDLLKIDQEERVYRFRCVEGWSMVIPWIGFPIKKLLEKVEPGPRAKYVAFQTFYPGSNPTGLKLPDGNNGMQSSIFAGISFPYIEGLRLDEAMHPMAILATGLYGKEMPNQNGAPIRLVVPWKYGFKSIKSVVRITLTEEQPPTTWNNATPNEYGFYSNVNPNVDHPRWSQATERRIGELGRRKTLLFNGYGEEVANLYKGMDLTREF
ncbi:MAG: protein-methionine-sulfoxide reductase catalytic subunit MsrP [Pyrinomonadaceae bacterium]|nr:protein-methionine-sulfoxide reductase catalytic subunit MsrP [Pyrinomonadaceae bacterium]